MARQIRKLYKIPVSWTVCATEHIRADSLVEALQMALDMEHLPSNGYYLDSSFEVNIEAAKEMNLDV